jgi:hypothetical protein
MEINWFRTKAQVRSSHLERQERIAYGYFAPLFIEGVNITCRSVVDVLHVCGKFLLVLPNHIPATVADLVHDTDLCGGFREYGAWCP